LGALAATLDCYRALVNEIIERQRNDKLAGDASLQQVEREVVSDDAIEGQQTTSKEQFGAERLAVRNERPVGQKISLRVNSVAHTLRGRLVIIFENGQVWRQPDSDSTVVPLPKNIGGRDAIIKRSFMGTYQMTIDGSGRKFRVIRVQ